MVIIILSKQYTNQNVNNQKDYVAHYENKDPPDIITTQILNQDLIIVSQKSALFFTQCCSSW